MLKRYFVNQGVKEVAIEQFIKSNFPTTDYSKIELQRTPLGIKIIIHTDKPGRVIGRSGEKINELNRALKTKFQLENPQLDVKAISNPDIDPRIVAKQIKLALERGYNYKKIGNLALKRIMQAGAIGAEIIISGKLGGSKGKTAKFIDGYLKHCGEPAKDLVDYGFEEAETKPGKAGIQVKIMNEFMTITGERRKRFELEKPVKEEEPVEEIEKVKGKPKVKKPKKEKAKKKIKPKEKEVAKKEKPKKKGKGKKVRSAKRKGKKSLKIKRIKNK